MSDNTSGIPRRTLLKGVLLSSVAMPLVACAPTGGTSDRTTDSKRISIMLLGPSQGVISYFNETLLPSFQAETGVSVELQQSDWGSGFQKITTAAASGTLADVVMLGGIWTAPLASRGVLLDIDGYLSGWDQAGSFHLPMLKDGSYDGTSYALPLYADIRTGVYRSDLLKQAGVDSLPTTWDEYRWTAEAIASSQARFVPVDWSLDKSVGLQQSFTQLLLQAGGSYFDAQGRGAASSDAGAAALDYLVSFYSDGLSDANRVYQGTGPVPLVAGTSAQNFNGVFLIENALQNDPPTAELITAGPPLAMSSGSQPTTTAWINKIGISAKSKYPDAAWELMAHITSKASAETLAELFGGLPARSDLSDASYLQKYPKGFVAASEHVVPLPSSRNMLQLVGEINIALQQAIRLELPAEEVLANIDAKINALAAK